MAAGDYRGVVLAGDIGGTKTHLGLYRAAGSELAMIRDQAWATHDFQSLEAAAAAFLGETESIDAACFGVPGPVLDGRSQPVNVPWTMDERAIASALKAPRTRLINDLEATAYGMLHLAETETAVLQRGAPPAHRAAIAVIAAGTGLGEAALVPTPSGWQSLASEGGHCDFAPRGREQAELLEFIAHEFGHASYERVCSGPGLVNIYGFLKRSMPEAEQQWLGSEIAGGDAAAAISEAALTGRDPRCVRALEIFIDIYAAEAANLALKTLAIGGVYLGGGIAPKILPALTSGRFVRAFNDKGRLAAMLERIPIRVSLNQAAALIGAAHCAMELLQ